MYINKVQICGVDTAKLPVLKELEIKSLLKVAHSGDKSAREMLINGNLRLVLSVVNRFAGRGENPDDLFQIGCIGLIKSIDNFKRFFRVFCIIKFFNEFIEFLLKFL